MNSILASSFLVILSLTQLPHPTLSMPPQESNEPNDLITTTCAQTQYQNLCTSFLKPFLNTTVNDIHTLAGISLKVALSNATGINTQIAEMQKKSSDKFIQQCLVDCAENYQDSVDRIGSSIKSLEAKGFNEVKTWVSAAMTNAEFCEEGFLGKQGYQSPMTRSNRIFVNLCSITLSITNLLVKAK